MAIRNPLVLDTSGRLEELPAGDVLATQFASTTATFTRTLAFGATDTLTLATVSRPVLLLGLSLVFNTPGVMDITVRIGGVAFMRLESVEVGFDSNVSYFFSGTGVFSIECLNRALSGSVSYTLTPIWGLL